MKLRRLAKVLGVMLAVAGTGIPVLFASTAPVLARGDGGGGGGAGGGGGGGGGADVGGGNGAGAIAPARIFRPAPPRPPRYRGPIVVRRSDRDAPGCIDYRIGMHSYYGYPIPVRCQPYLYPYSVEFD
jgi:hypothetical protein